MSNGMIGILSVPPTPIPPIGVVIGPPSVVVKPAILEAIELGYRHIQATIPGTPEQHQASRDAIVEALSGGLINSRKDLFISCRLQYNGAAPDTITNDLKTFLESQQLRYIDLFLIQWPADGNPNDDLTPVWTAMENCQFLGLAKSIGVCDFSTSMLEIVLSSAAIPPFANQVGMQVYLTGKELRQFCKDNLISLAVISTIGGPEGNDQGFAGFEELEGLEKIAKEKQKTTEEAVHRWAYEQGASLLLESLRKEHLQELLTMLQWDLSQDK